MPRTGLSLKQGGSLMSTFQPIDNPQLAVLGGGAWGTALASVVARHHNKPVTLWAREAETVAAINNRHENDLFLPGIALPESISATQHLAELAASDIILMVVPAQFARAVLAELAPLMKADASLVLCSKGIEQSGLSLMSDVAGDFMARAQIAVLSGPSFAADVARGLPTAVTLACADEKRGMYLCDEIGAAAFRPYYTDDVIGAEIGGALKNVLAIACGIVAGKQLGGKRACGSNGARLCRNGAPRRQPRRSARNIGRAIGAGRPHPHLFQRYQPQFFIGPRFG